ncbi:hypothetical protein RHGRI_003220 [Rhododendron griersonianum]|uniref:ATPase AAA-type core domain-containing protein n=1 Tax=Rhododendron griersonianum TaxID=479676 RepID=A0AAV6L445_9ERIC|nr:hypothetical protein RHGRI_003220 [Rhododendron griersonianum]
MESREALLQSKAADLLEKACGTLRFRLDAGEVDEDEKSLDADEYKLVRSCVEIHEIKKEKDPDREAWLHHELRDSMDNWDCYFNKWKPFPKKQHKRSPEILVKEAQLLQGLLQELLSCLPNNGSLHSSIRTDRWNEMVRQLDVLVTLNSNGFDKKFQQFITVGPKLIAKVASSETGFPASWLLHSSLKPPVDDLAIGSFLFLCGHRHDGPELAEALTEELFEGKGSLIYFDLSKYTEPDSVSRLLGVPTSQGELGSSGELTDALEKNPFSIVLFSNIDAASVSVVDMVTEISRCGRLTNSQGKTIDFTKTLIIMTSTIGVDKEVSFACNCFRMVEECPIKELLNLHPEESKHRCSTFSRLKEGGEKLVKVWLEENLVPVLQLMCGKGEIKDNYIIYIDTLVGTQELSYRLVKLEDFFEEQALKQVVQRGMKEEVDLSLGDGGSKRAKKGVESLKAQLHNGLWGQATNIVAKAAKMIMDAPHYLPSLPVAAFLFLGLTTSSKEKIIGDLAENFVADDGAKLLFTIDLSEYTDLNSLSRLTDTLSGMFIDHRGRTVGFRDTIVIISSDAGNKGIFSRLVGHASQNILDSDTKQDGDSVGDPPEEYKSEDIVIRDLSKKLSVYDGSSCILV